MSTISAEITPMLIKDNKLEVSCSYNNDDAANEAQNQKALQPFELVAGLPALTTPLAVNNLMFTDGNHLIGEGQAIIVPVGACFTLDFAFLSTLGYRVTISLLATGEVISENALFWTTPKLSTADYQKCSIGTWDDGSVLKSDDPRFGESKNEYAPNTFQLKVECSQLNTLSQESQGSDSQLRSTSGDSTSMLIEFLVMDEDHYHPSNISFYSQPTTSLGD